MEIRKWLDRLILMMRREVRSNKVGPKVLDWRVYEFSMWRLKGIFQKAL